MDKNNTFAVLYRHGAACHKGTYYIITCDKALDPDRKDNFHLVRIYRDITLKQYDTICRIVNPYRGYETPLIEKIGEMLGIRR